MERPEKWMIFLCGDVLNCQVLSDSMNALWVAAQNAEIQYLFFGRSTERPYGEAGSAGQIRRPCGEGG